MADEKILSLRSDSQKAENYFSKQLAFTLDPMELKNLSDNINLQIIDVRMLSDYEVGHIPNSISIPYNEIDVKIPKLNKENLFIIYSYNNICNLSAQIAYKLAKNNFAVMTLKGGFTSWAEDFHFAVE